MPEPNPQEVKALRHSIERFIRSRLKEKLEPHEKARDKAEADSDAFNTAQAKIDELKAKFEVSAWLESAAKRSSQIKLATHPIKMTHSEAKGSSVYLPTGTTSCTQLLSTATLGSQRAEDIVGNAAALDVYKFLKTQHGETRLLDLALNRDSNFQAALSDNKDTAEQWAISFSNLAKLDTEPSSHSLAKQLYWPLPDGSYQLLSPLASSSLSHAIFQHIREDRFSEEAKAARDARKASQPHTRHIREYPDLMAQKMGGSNTQNVSQLNRDRAGTNYLLPSCPPKWQNQGIQPPLRVETIFGRTLGRQRPVWFAVTALAKYLVSLKPEDNNVHIRRKRQALTSAIVDEVLVYGYTLQQLPSGWSESSALPMTERYWLDPSLAQTDEVFAQGRTFNDWPNEIGDRFGTWLNGELLRAKLKISDVEHKYWLGELKAELKTFKEELRHAGD